MTEADLERILGRVVRREFERIVDSAWFRCLMRESVLRVLVEQQDILSHGAARSFLHECEARGVRVWLDEHGQARTEPQSGLGTDLAAVLVAYRTEITRLLERFRDAERLREQRTANGQAKTPLPQRNP